MKTISSNPTFAVKVALPIAWIAGMTAITLSSWLGLIHKSNGAPLPPQLNWLFLATRSVGTPLVPWIGALLKKVRMDSSNLYISNLRKEIVVPFSNVARVTENPQNGVYPVTVYFRTRTAFGRKITFLTTFRLSTWSPHSVRGNKDARGHRGAMKGDVAGRARVRRKGPGRPRRRAVLVRNDRAASALPCSQSGPRFQD